MSPAAAVKPPTLNEIRAAAGRLEGVTRRTPLVPLHGADRNDLRLKLEIHQPVTSFKLRGVYHAVASLDPAARAAGLLTVSAGNTAQALAWCGRRFEVRARSIMPEGAPATKIDAVRAYGGEPVLVPVDEVFRFLREHLWEREPDAFIHPWTERNVMIGHGTMGLEIVEQVPEVETVYVPVGGGGLLGGVGTALRAMRPGIRLIAVEPEGCPSLHESIRRGRPAEVACDTICDGVAVPYITDEMFPLLRDLADETVLVPEADVKATIRHLAFGNKIVVEGSAALSVAAALAAPEKWRRNAVCLITGGSIDPAKLAGILAAPPDRM